MSISKDALSNMNYIQGLFLKVQAYMQTDPEWENLPAFLDSEPIEFRSVGYETASIILGFKDLSNSGNLDNWEKFYRSNRKYHAYHIEVGLGWSFAKAGIIPSQNWSFIHPQMLWMIFDGMGYYYGLFKGRKTVKNQLIPDGVKGQNLQGFDQGLGRRLWYISKSDVNELVKLIQAFPSSRHSDLWRGIGMACGYVGGMTKENLQHLAKASGGQKKQLCIGIALSAISRNESNSITQNIKMACEVIGHLTFEEAISHKIINQSDWLSYFETKFMYLR